MDLPCDELVVRVRSDTPDEVTCNLPPPASEKDGELLYRSSSPLPAGHLLHVTVGRVPVPWTTYARWAAVGTLIAAVAGAAVTVARRNGRPRGGYLNSSGSITSSPYSGKCR